MVDPDAEDKMDYREIYIIQHKPIPLLSNN